MVRYRIVQLLFAVSSLTSQVVGMEPAEKVVSSLQSSVQEIGKGIAQKIEELPKELKYKIFSSALELRENQKYELYKKFDVVSPVSEIVLNENNTRVLTGSFDGIVSIWDVESGSILIELKGHTAAISSMALSADDRALALTGSGDKTVRIWDMNTGETIRILEVGSYITSVALSADGSIALIGSFDGIGRLYNTCTGEFNELKGHTDHIRSVALSADGSSALTASEGIRAWVWDIPSETDILTANPIRTLEVGSNVTSVTSVALSADGTTGVTVTDENKVLVWNVKTGALLNTLLTDGTPIMSITLSKDGKRALTGTTDGKIWVRNLKPLPGKKETSTPLTVLAGHTERVRTVAFGGADFIASCSDDRTVIIWKPFALEPRDPQENVEVLSQAYKEILSRPLLSSVIEDKQI